MGRGCENSTLSFLLMVMGYLWTAVRAEVVALCFTISSIIPKLLGKLGSNSTISWTFNKPKDSLGTHLSVMEITKSHPGHTPFCKNSCSVKHCELIMCLVNCPDNKRMIKGLASLKQSLFQALQEGWNPHANVVDPLIEFQSPLVHWASVLGKDFALEWLIKMNFRTNAVCDRTGESAVHRMLKCLYAVKQLDGMNAREIFNLFSHLLSLLTGSCSDVLSIQDNEGNTPFHTCALLIISQEGTTSELEYFENCMVTMLRSLSGDKSSTLNTDLCSVLNLKNKNSETILHILARRNASFNIMRYVIRRFNHVIDKNSLNMEGKSAFDIAIKSEMYSVAKELESTEAEGSGDQTSSLSVDAHIGEWDPNFGKSKTQTSKPKTKSRRSQSARSSNKSATRFDNLDCEEANEVDTVDVDSSSSTSSSCVYVTYTTSDENNQVSSPDLVVNQRTGSPGSMQSSSGPISDKSMDVNIAGMISVNLTNVVAIDTEDLSVKSVTQESSCSTGDQGGNHQSFSFSQVHTQRSESRRKSTSSSGITGSFCSSETHKMTETRRDVGASKQDMFQSPHTTCQHSGNNAYACATSCSPLIKLIKEDNDVASLLEARLKDKRQKLESYLHDYTKQMREMEKRGSRCCLLLSEYKDERDTIMMEEQLKEQEKKKLLKRIEELEKSSLEPKKRLKFLEGKIVELEALSEQSLKTIEIRNDYCSEVKRKLAEYDNALNEIAGQSVSSKKRIKVEPLDK